MPSLTCFRTTYLNALSATLQKRQQLQPNQLPHAVLGAISEKPQPSVVAKQIPRLKGGRAKNIVGTVKKFQETCGKLPPAVDNAPHTIQIELEYDALLRVEDFVKEYSKQAGKLSQEGRDGSVDLRLLDDMARKINPYFNSGYDADQLAEIGFDHWIDFQKEVVKQVLLPVNRGIVHQLVGGEDPLTLDFLIDRSTWSVGGTYADHVIWHCDARLSDQGLGYTSQTFGEYVLMDRKKIVDEAIGMFIQNEIMPANRSTRLVVQSGLSLDQLGDEIGYQRQLRKQIESARNQILVAEWLAQHPAEVFEMDDMQRGMAALLLEDAPLRESVVSVGERWSAETSVSSVITQEIASSLGGIISEMEYHIALGKPRLATIAFLDYYGTESRRELRYAASDPLNQSITYASNMIVARINQSPELKSKIDNITRDQFEAEAEPILNILKQFRDNNFRNLSDIIY